MFKLYIIIFLLISSFEIAAQGPILEYFTEISGKPPTGAFIPQPQGSALDVNDDGVKDILIVSKQNNELIVKSGNSNQTWIYPLGIELAVEKIERGFIGFYEMNNNSPFKEAVFAHKVGKQLNEITILNQDPSENKQLSDKQFLIGVSDIDDDGIEELQIYNAENGELELWGPGPKIELYPSSFSLDSILIDLSKYVVTYKTEVDGESRNMKYRFLQNQTVDIDVESFTGDVLASYNSEDNYNIPDETDEQTRWLLGQNIIVSSSLGVIQIWKHFKDLFSPDVEQGASSGMGILGGILKGIPGLIDHALCRSSGTATCTDDDGTTTTVNCNCGIAQCLTQQTSVVVTIVETDPNTGERTQREETQYKNICVCTCLSLKQSKN